MSISSLVLPKRPDPAVLEQLNPSALNFGSTQQPETVPTSPTNYACIDSLSDKGNVQNRDLGPKGPANGGKVIDLDQNSPIAPIIVEKSLSNQDQTNNALPAQNDQTIENSGYHNDLVFNTHLPKTISQQQLTTTTQSKIKTLDEQGCRRLEVSGPFHNDVTNSKNPEIIDDKKNNNNNSDNDNETEKEEENDQDSENDKDFNSSGGENSDDESSSGNDSDSDSDGEESDNNGSDYNDDSTAEDEDEDSKDHVSLARIPKVTRQEIELLKKDLEANQDLEESNESTATETKNKNRKNSQSPKNVINDAAYLAKNQEIETKALQEERYIEDIDYNFDFLKQGDGSDVAPHHTEAGHIQKAYPKNIVNPRGLMNTGVTCYMNSALQALFHIPAMACYLQDVFNDKYRDNLPAKSVTRDVALLHQKLTDPEARKKSFIPRQLIKRLDDINPLMSKWDQEDSHEYFMSLLGRLQEDSVPKGMKLNSSIIHKMFGGTFLQTVVCQECNHESKTHQDFFDIQVSIDKNELKYTDKATLKGSFRHYFETSMIHKTQTEGYDCEKCKKKTDATTNVKIEHAPEYLVVSVKRYEYTNNAMRGSSQKIKHHLQLASQLELSQFADDTENPMRYELLSFVSHEGRSASSGHYIAHCLQNDDNWVMYDDEFVQKVGNTSKMLKSKLDVYFMVYARLQAVPKTHVQDNSHVHTPVGLGRQRISDVYKTADEGYSEEASSQDEPVFTPEQFSTYLDSQSSTSTLQSLVNNDKLNDSIQSSANPLLLSSLQLNNTLNQLQPKDLEKSNSTSSSSTDHSEKATYVTPSDQNLNLDEQGDSVTVLISSKDGSHSNINNGHDIVNTPRKNSRNGETLNEPVSQKKRKVGKDDN